MSMHGTLWWSGILSRVCSQLLFSVPGIGPVMPSWTSVMGRSWISQQSGHFPKATWLLFCISHIALQTVSVICSPNVGRKNKKHQHQIESVTNCNEKHTLHLSHKKKKGVETLTEYLEWISKNEGHCCVYIIRVWEVFSNLRYFRLFNNFSVWHLLLVYLSLSV